MAHGLLTDFLNKHVCFSRVNEVITTYLVRDVIMGQLDLISDKAQRRGFRTHDILYIFLKTNVIINPKTRESFRKNVFYKTGPLAI